MRTDNNPRLKGGRICLNRSKDTLTIKLHRNSGLFPRRDLHITDGGRQTWMTLAGKLQQVSRVGLEGKLNDR